jgi:hypothetical protein
MCLSYAGDHKLATVPDSLCSVARANWLIFAVIALDA